MKHVVLTLLGSADPNVDALISPFIECISRVFAHLAESYVDLLRGNIDPSEFAAQDAVAEAIASVLRTHTQLDARAFERGINRFLVETDPEFDAIKWNMTQNFYLLTVLGVDSGAYLLTEDVFRGAIFYLDTNVVIAALQPRARFHTEYKRLASAFRDLGIKIRVSQETLNELRAVVDYERAGLQQAAGQVPDALESRVNDRFFHAYREAERRGESDPVSVVFESFLDPVASLTELAETALEDDEWFDREKYDVHTGDLSRELQAAAERIHPGRPKKDRAAQHDALMLRWVENRRAGETRNIWFLTLDGTLCAFESDSAARGSIHRNLALTLDAVLLWLAPIISMGGVVGEGIAEIFADALRNQLLPKQKLLDLRDFLVFSEIGIECRNLPAEDVEDCIQFIEREMPSLDSTKAEDRERLSAEISKFFVDPGRKYVMNLQVLEEEVAALRSRLDADARARSSEEARLRREFEEELQARERQTAEQEAAVSAELGRQIGEVSDRLAEEQRERKRDQLRLSGFVRLVCCLIGLLVLELGVALVTNHQGAGDTALQRIGSLWELHAFVFVVGLAATRLIVGKERIVAMGWSVDFLHPHGSDAA